MSVLEQLGYKRRSKHAALKKKPKPKPYEPYLAQRTYKNVMFFYSSASRIESGRYVVLLTAIARQCSVYRTLVLKREPTKDDAKRQLVKWIKSLPVDDIK